MDETAFKKELLFLILTILYEEGLKETAHKLERESGLYFDMKYFKYMVLAGKWDDAETYLSGFTKIDNYQSVQIYYALRKQKYIEALGNNNRTTALDILMKDLKLFSQYYGEAHFKELTQLMTLNNIREHESLSIYGDITSLRWLVMDAVEQAFEANPVLKGKLKFLSIDSETLRNFELLCDSL